jgi:hypothetical protein
MANVLQLSNDRLIVSDTGTATITASTGEDSILVFDVGGTDWAMGIDNSEVDRLKIAGGASTIGSSDILSMSARYTTSGDSAVYIMPGTSATVTIPSGTNGRWEGLLFGAKTINYTGTTTVTAAGNFPTTVNISPWTFVGDTATLTIELASSIRMAPPIAGTNVIVSESAAIVIQDPGSGSGTTTDLVGIKFEALSSGGTRNSYFEFPADNTDPTGGGGAATGRVPILIAGATKYLPYY